MSFRTGLLPRLLNARSFILPALRASPPRKSLVPFYTLGLGLSIFTVHSISSSQSIQCQSPSALPINPNRPRPEVGGGNPSPQSELSGFQLGFGAVCGICTGVFVKKGLKAIAFLLGGVFILMQVGHRPVICLQNLEPLH